MTVQVYFDIGTPAEVFKVVNEEIEKHMEANQNELTGEFACCNFGCAPASSSISLTTRLCNETCLVHSLGGSCTAQSLWDAILRERC